MKKNHKCYIYTRVSTAIQVDGYSLEAQKDKLRKYAELLSENRVLEEFDLGVFESIVEKVIIGGYDEEGNKDPYKVTFIYKTGFRNGVDNSKKKYGKMCSDRTSELDNLCSNDSTDARGSWIEMYNPIIYNDDNLLLLREGRLLIYIYIFFYSSRPMVSNVDIFPYTCSEKDPEDNEF